MHEQTNTARRLANIIRLQRTKGDGIDEEIELFPQDLELLQETAEMIQIPIEETIRRLVAYFFQPSRKAELEKRIGIRWRANDIEMERLTVRFDDRYTSYIERWRPDIGTWGTQLTNSALDWFRTITSARPDESTAREKVVKYLRENGIPYHVDIISETDLGQTRNAEKQLNEPGWPDIFIPRASGGYNGLFIELKQEAPMVNNEHFAKQLEQGQKLEAEGYKFIMAFGAERAIQAIQLYITKGGK